MFSNSTKYAIRTILFLARLEEGKKATVGEIAPELDIPKPYLSKLLQRLSTHGIIESSKGRGGGFYLLEKNLKLPLIEVVKCLDGKDVFKECLLGLPTCSDKNPCILHSDYRKFKKDMEKIMIKESLQDLLNKSNSKDLFLN